MYFDDMNSGYDGYSMSKNATRAYLRGEMPISKWTKAELLKSIEETGILDEETMQLLSKVRLPVLKNRFLRHSGWHHTSKKCRRTDFFEIDEGALRLLTPEKVRELIIIKSGDKDEYKHYKGTVKYLEWIGSKAHPKSKERIVTNAEIEERGCYYYIRNEKGILLAVKRMDSYGTTIWRD